MVSDRNDVLLLPVFRSPSLVAVAVLPVVYAVAVAISSMSWVLLLKAVHTEIVELHVPRAHLGRTATICKLLASIIGAVHSEGRLGVNRLSPLELWVSDPSAVRVVHIQLVSVVLVGSHVISSSTAIIVVPSNAITALAISPVLAEEYMVHILQEEKS